MTGAGTTEVAHTRETDFLADPSDPTYVVPGRNPTVQNVELSNALARSRLPGDNESIESIAQDLEGALEVQYDLTHPWTAFDGAFGQAPTMSGSGPYTATWTMGSGQAATQRWYVGLDVASATAERELQGALTTQVQLQISRGSNAQVTQTIVYADEEFDTTLSPGSIVGKNETPYVYHGGQFDLDGTTQKKMQEATLQITNGASLDGGWDRKALDATLGEAEYSLDASKIVTDTVSDNVALAYGDAAGGATEPVDHGEVEAVDGSIELSKPGDNSITIPLETVQTDTYGWDNIPPSGEDRAQESMSFHVAHVEVEAETATEYPF